jgi:hypothetical protein
MEDKPDLRSIEEIPFLEHTGDVRRILKAAQLITADQVIQAGCTGLVASLYRVHPGQYTVQPFCAIDPIRDATIVRKNMGGAGFGLPCYVPPTRFCFVHNIIGGLQQGQEARYFESVPLCSRELTEEEQKHAAAVNAKIMQDGLKEAAAHFGVESCEDKAVSECNMPPPNASPAWLLNGQFRCPEHKEIEWKCRYCLAAAIIQGPFEPVVELQVQFRSGLNRKDTVPIERLESRLSDVNTEVVEVYARIKRWARELVVVEE